MRLGTFRVKRRNELKGAIGRRDANGLAFVTVAISQAGIEKSVA